jgi:diguanylate cyclase (GGDEF)-like protein
MNSWDEEFHNLQVAFLRGGPERLAEIDDALGRLADRPDDRDALAQLKRLSHRLTGSGATYDRPAISAAASQIERLCDVRLAAAAVPSAADIAAWREARNALAEAFEQPLPTVRAATVPDPSPEVPLRTDPEFSVLVVDADPEDRARLQSALEREGYAVTLLDTVRDACELIDRRLPDGIIVDRRLADGAGTDIILHLRQRPDGDVPAAVMLAAAGDMLDQVEAIHIGADACYVKPDDVEQAVRRLVQLFDRRRADAPRILVVEDDEYHASFARTVLESAGYQVEICGRPRDFHERMAAFHPELILMDVNLPEVTGYDLARLVRQQEQHTALPIIFLTSEGEMESRIAAAKAGGDEHLTKPVHPALLASAVGARIERARLLRTLLYRDGLTRLLTHASFMDKVEQAVKRRERGATAPLTLVMLDVDHFKQINDTHGHQAGDRVLVSLASLLRRHLRRTDVSGRYGGEEFAILLEDIGAAATGRLVDRLLDAFRRIEHTTPDGRTFRSTFSAGVAQWQPGMDRHSWIDAADAALYAAKRAGRDRVHVVDSAA